MILFSFVCAAACAMHRFLALCVCVYGCMGGWVNPAHDLARMFWAESGESVPRAANFFINYVCLSALTWFPMELCDPVQLVLVPLRV